MPAKRAPAPAPAAITAPVRAAAKPAAKAATRSKSVTAVAVPSVKEVSPVLTMTMSEQSKNWIRTMLTHLFENKDELTSQAAFISAGFEHFRRAMNPGTVDTTPVPAGRKGAQRVQAESSDSSGVTAPEEKDSPAPAKISIKKLIPATAKKQLVKAVDSAADSAESHTPEVAVHLETGSRESGTSSAASSGGKGETNISLEEFIELHSPEVRGTKGLICAKYFSRNKNVCAKLAKPDHSVPLDKKEPVAIEYRARCSKACSATLPETLFKAIKDLNFQKSGGEAEEAVEAPAKKTTKKTAAPAPASSKSPREGLPAKLPGTPNLPAKSKPPPTQEPSEDEGEVDADADADAEAEGEEQFASEILEHIFGTISEDEQICVLLPNWYKDAKCQECWPEAVNVVSKTERKEPVCVFVNETDPANYVLVGMVTREDYATLIDPESENKVTSVSAFGSHPILRKLLKVTDDTDFTQVNFARAVGLTYNHRNKSDVEPTAIPGTPEVEDE